MTKLALLLTAAAVSESPRRRSPADDCGRSPVDAPPRLAGCLARRPLGGLHRLHHRLGQEQASQHARAARPHKGRGSAAARRWRREGPRRCLRSGRGAVVPDGRWRPGSTVPDARRGLRRFRSAISRATLAGSRLRHRARWPSSGPIATFAAPTSIAGTSGELEDRVRTDLRPALHPPLGQMGRARSHARACSLSRSRAGSSVGPGIPIEGGPRRGHARPSPSAEARKSPSRATVGTSISRFGRRAEPRKSRPISIFSRHRRTEALRPSI